MQRVNWDDFRFVLSVAETGSVGAAARALGVNHATVLRRISAFEEAQGIELFVRSPQGYAIHPGHLKVVEALREAAAAMEGVTQTIRGRGRHGTETVRITSTDSLCVSLLPGVVARLQAATPGLSLRLRSTNLALDLARLDADLTVRPAMALPETLQGVEAGVLAFGVYAAEGAEPKTWLGLGSMLSKSPAARWMERNVPPEEVRGGADSFVVLRELVAQGMGRGLLPCCLGDGDPRLQRLADVGAALNVPIWVATHGSLGDSPRLGVLRDALVEGLRAAAPVFEGRVSAAREPGSVRPPSSQAEARAVRARR